MRTPRPIALALVSLALVAGAAACSSDDGSDGADTTTTTEEAAATTTTGGDDSVPDDEDDETTTTASEADLGDADRDAYVAALAGSFGEDTDGIFEDGQIECLSEGFVDVLGVDNLKEAGIAPDALAETNGSDFPEELGVDEEKANQMFDVYEDCDVDFGAVFKEVFGGLVGPEGLSAEDEACIDELLTSDNLRRSLVADILGEDLEDDPLDEVENCVDLGALGSGGSGPTAEGVTPSTVTVPG